MAGKFNDRFFDELGNAPKMTAALTDVAERVAARARAAAPVDEGNYRDSIHVEMRQSAHRKVAVVVADDEAAMFVESRTGNLARALIAEAR